VNALGTGAGAPGGGEGRDPADQSRLGQLAAEQAALRRVATLVARGEPPEAVFAAVAEEVGQLFRVDLANLFRYEPDRSEALGGSIHIHSTPATGTHITATLPLAHEPAQHTG
jgi:GAF domain-containing protein